MTPPGSLRCGTIILPQLTHRTPPVKSTSSRFIKLVTHTRLVCAKYKMESNYEHILLVDLPMHFRSSGCSAGHPEVQIKQVFDLPTNTYHTLSTIVFSHSIPPLPVLPKIFFLWLMFFTNNSKNQTYRTYSHTSWFDFMLNFDRFFMFFNYSFYS